MGELAGNARVRWGGAAALMVAVLLLSVLDAFPLVLLPLAFLLVMLPPRRLSVMGVGVLLGVAGFLMAPGPMTAFARGWALILAAAFGVLSLLRRNWGFVPRALSAVGASMVATGLWLVGTKQWAVVDDTFLKQFRTASQVTLEQLKAGAPDSAWVKQFAEVADSVVQMQWKLFPSMLALQSVAALALAWWAFSRLRQREDEGWIPLRPLRYFRFNDQLVWLLIAGLALVLIPLGSGAARAGWNTVFFMGNLYMLRGVAVLMFLSAGAPMGWLLLVGLSAALFLFPLVVVLYPLVLAAALVVGLGDTWLDVRGRVAMATRA